MRLIIWISFLLFLSSCNTQSTIVTRCLVDPKDNEILCHKYEVSKNFGRVSETWQENKDDTYRFICVPVGDYSKLINKLKEVIPLD